MFLFNRKPSVEFEMTTKYGDIKIDEGRQLFKVSGKIIPFADLESFELLEDEQKITEGGISLGRAVVGGALLGASGAGLAGLSKVKKADKEYCNSMKIILTLRNQKNSVLMIPIIFFKVDKAGSAYQEFKASALATLKGLNHIIEATAVANAPVVDKSIQEYENLKKLKELFDLGILTEAEFNEKKAVLLKTE